LADEANRYASRISNCVPGKPVARKKRYKGKNEELLCLFIEK